jgi:hypothetical protein
MPGRGGRFRAAGPTMTDAPLTLDEATRILTWLGVPAATGDGAWLDALLRAYGQRVPWESASRVVRRARHVASAACVQSPRAFWDAAMARGHGGTCFESNAALAALLDAVGIPSVLTINDRPPVPACHTALIVEADGERFVVDAGFPLYAAVPLPTGNETREARTAWGTFSASPSAPGRYRIGQHPHPRPLAFELVDRPVSRDRYHAATCADYGPDGLFLDRVIIKRIVAGDMWRFASGERPWVLERFCDGLRETQPLPPHIEACAAALGAHFGLDTPTVERALALVTRGGPPVQ